MSVLTNRRFCLLVGFVIASLPIAEGVWGQVSPGDLRINEFVATNQEGLQDEDGDFEDWLEIENLTGSSKDLTNVYLTDDLANRLKWQFPPIMLPAGGFLLVFASGKDRAPLAGELHASFRMNREGEAIAIVDSASTIIDSIAPVFPPQFPGFSYGIDPISGELRYLQPPTPNAPNNASTPFVTFLQDVSFSVDSGLFDQTFALGLSHPDPSAAIHYTINGGTPTLSSPLFSGSIQILTTSVIRARAFRPGFVPSAIGTRTYLFDIDEAIKTLPVMSVVTAPDNLEGPRGLISNPQGRGRIWERPGNVEIINADGSPGFNHPVGIRIHGGANRTRTKLSFRLYFREEYGRDRLFYPLVPDSTVEDFKRIVVRSGVHDLNPFVNDELMRRCFRDMGNFSSRGGYVNLFINGEHKGYYNPTERMDRFFFRSWFGGEEDWDITGTSHQDGDLVAWDEILDLAANSDLNVPANYAQLENRLDLVNYVDYLLVYAAGGTFDWPGNNWVVARERTPGFKFRFFVWDAEQSWGHGRVPTFNTVSIAYIGGDGNAGTPVSLIYRAVDENPDFQFLFASRFRKQFFEDGPLTESGIMSRFLPLRSAVVDSVLVSNQNYIANIANTWIPGRRHNVEFILDEVDLLDTTGLDLTPKPLPQVAINEFMAINNSTIADESGEFDDWVELYNLTNNPLDVSGMFLTDSLQNPTRWEIPAGTVIPARGTLLIWADNNIAQGPFHASFALNGAGETIALFDSVANGTGELDVVAFGPQIADISEGRQPDGTGPVGALDVPTQDALNGSRAPEFDLGPPRRFNYSGQRHGERTIVADDFNRDGALDLAIGNFNHGTIRILLGQGDGTFQDETVVAAGRVGLAAMVVGDFNGDMYPDIAAAHDVMLNYWVSILINDMNGSFNLQGVVPINTEPEAKHLHPRSMIARNMDGDADVDLLVQNESSARPGFLSPDNRVSILDNDGNGNFSVGSTVAGGVAVLTSLQSLVAENLNQDNNVDLVALSGAFTLELILNQGGGTFAAPVSLPASGTAILRSVVAADFDGDSDIDLAACNDLGGDVIIYTNDGMANFTLESEISVQVLRPNQLLVGDFNSDNNPDIAVANFDPILRTPAFIQILFNKGDGTFNASEPFATGPELPFPHGLAAGNFDGDGGWDLAVTDEYNGLLSVFTGLELIAPPTADVEHWELLK